EIKEELALSRNWQLHRIDQVHIAKHIESNTRKKTSALGVERRSWVAVGVVGVKCARATHDGVVVGIAGPCHFRCRVIYLLPERRQQVSPVHSVVEGPGNAALVKAHSTIILALNQ